MVVARILGSIAIALVAGCAGLEGARDIEAQIVALEHVRAQAQLRGDWEAMLRVNAADFTEIAGDGSVRTGAENNAAMRDGILKFDSVDYSDLRVRAEGNTAIVTGVARRTGSYRGVPFEQHLRYSRVYVRAEGSWKAVFAQNTRIEAPARR